MQAFLLLRFLFERAIIILLLGSKICFKINRVKISSAIDLILNRTNTSNIMDY